MQKIKRKKKREESGGAQSHILFMCNTSSIDPYIHLFRRAAQWQGKCDCRGLWLRRVAFATDRDFATHYIG